MEMRKRVGCRYGESSSSQCGSGSYRREKGTERKPVQDKVGAEGEAQEAGRSSF